MNEAVKSSDLESVIETSWEERLKRMECNQIVLVLRDNMPLSECSRLCEDLKKYGNVLAALPNVIERKRDGE